MQTAGQTRSYGSAGVLLQRFQDGCWGGGGESEAEGQRVLSVLFSQ